MRQRASSGADPVMAMSPQRFITRFVSSSPPTRALTLSRCTRCSRRAPSLFSCLNCKYLCPHINQSLYDIWTHLLCFVVPQSGRRRVAADPGRRRVHRGANLSSTAATDCGRRALPALAPDRTSRHQGKPILRGCHATADWARLDQVVAFEDTRDALPMPIVLLCVQAYCSLQLCLRTVLALSTRKSGITTAIQCMAYRGCTDGARIFGHCVRHMCLSLGWRA